MRRTVWCALVATACTAMAASAAPVTEVVVLSAQSPFPEQGCGQQDPDFSSPGRGTVEMQGPERGQESDLALVVNPADPLNVVAAWVQDSGLGIVVASSSDGGGTFSRTTVPKLTVCNGGSAQHVLHARLAAAPDGTLYLAGETLNGYWEDPRSAVVTIPVSTSRDGGESWSEPQLVPAPPALGGLDTIAAGPDGLVVAWHAPEPFAATYISTTDDGGRTWTQMQVPGGSPDGLPLQRVVVEPDGTLHLLTVEATLRGFLADEMEPTQVVLGEQPAALVSRTLHAGGTTWSDPALVAQDLPMQWVGGVMTPRNHLLTTWLGRGTPECAAPLFSSSRAQGEEEWTEPVLVTCDAVGSSPSPAAHPDGRLGIATTSSYADGQQQQRLHVSDDGGASWAPTALGDPFAPPEYAGYYQETAAGPDAFYSIFLRANYADGERTDALLGIARDPAEANCREHVTGSPGELEQPGPELPPCVSQRDP